MGGPPKFVARKGAPRMTFGEESPVLKLRPLPYLYRCRAAVAAPQCITKRLRLAVSPADVRNRKALESALLREVLHKYLPVEQLPQPLETKKTHSGEAEASPSRHVVGVSDIVLHADSAAQQGRALLVDVSAKLTLATVSSGLMAGVAQTSAFDGLMSVKVPVTLPSGKRARAEDPEAWVDLLARVNEAEVAQPGQVVLVQVQAGGIACTGVRVPRVAPGPFVFAEETSTDHIDDAAVGFEGFTEIVCQMPEKELKE